MSKRLAVVAFVLAVLWGAMGLQTVAVSHEGPATADSSLSMQGRPFPRCPPSCGQ